MERADPRLLGPQDAARPRALIVDDDAVGRIALKKLLSKCGYEADVAVNGEDGVRTFSERRPDIVFMDMMMPVMDGLAATLHIKRACGQAFVPVIFITGNTDEDDVARCIEAGGDDFVTKPYSHTVLAAKIRAMERISDLHRRTRALHSRMQDEQALAKRILESAVMGPNAMPPGLGVHLSPAATFNGDLLLSAAAPSGDLHILLGDFTGHGLAATIGALPVAETFRAMTAKGFSPATILAELNRKLRALLPTGMFLAAILVTLDAQKRHVAAINAGMPDVLLLNGDTIEVSVASAALPLAVVEDENYAGAEVVLPWIEGGRVVLASDGAIEAADASGALFGAERLRRALTLAAARPSAISQIVAAIDGFCNGMPPADDVSLVEIALTDRLFARREARAPTEAGPRACDTSDGRPDGDSGWRFQIELRGSALRSIGPVPIVMSLLREFPEVASHCPTLFTVVAELYNNALDHGVLGLSSALKAQDFATYLHERDTRLAADHRGHVSIAIDCDSAGEQGTLEIAVADSGRGFDSASLAPTAEDAPHGRGIRLVRALCRSLEHAESGTLAVARFALSPQEEDSDAHPDRR